ncbi:MAG: hypothetical protein WCT77_13615 [Bacteroidota bacterium]
MKQKIMKVELEKIRLGVTALGSMVVVFIPDKNGITSKYKKDVTSDFLKAIVDYAKNSRLNIVTQNTKISHQVCVKKSGGFKREILTRKEVIKLIEKSISEGVTKDKCEEFIKNNLK